MPDIKHERALFINQTAHLNIFKQPRTNTYYQFRLFQINAIELLNPHFDKSCIKWAIDARNILENQRQNSSQAQSIEEIESYRRVHLGLDHFGPEQTNEMDALTTLIRLALENWPSNPASESEASIVQGIDEFSNIFLETFGNGESLLRIFKNSFNFD